MHIKCIEIHGFKSYGNKTIIKDFDPFFNAITGLNGSGKSNILDSICFVLGITNLTNVRAANLQELVYKNGQAGVTKASVSITFDNSDPATSPVGYEAHKELTVTRTVVIGGRNKYLINGTTAQNHKVQDFFQSVQLNVNNPHFLIMQGRITKVLNMKPMEILSMVEEAAGTRMYEMKKANSLKLMERKEAKLNEIERIFKEEINPNLEKLRNERKDFIEYTKVCQNFERVSKLHVAMQFVRAQESCASYANNMLGYQETFTNAEKTIETLNGRINEFTVKITEMEKLIDEEVGGKLRSLEATLKDEQMEETKLANGLQNLKSSLKDHCKKKVQSTKSLNEDKKTLEKKGSEEKRLEKEVEHLKQVQEEDANAVSEAEKHMHDVNAGLIKDKEGKAATIASQVITAEGEIQNSETVLKTATMNLAHFKKELSNKQSTCTNMDVSYKGAQSSVQHLENEIKDLKNHMDKLGYDEKKLDKLKVDKISLEKEIYHLKVLLEEMESRYPQLIFDYVDPERNFDRSKVSGVVCKLIEVKDNKNAMALEISAGGKLYSVVVDTDTTAKLLLSRGQLKRRCTIIPLNKIIGQVIPKEVIQRAVNLVGKQNVAPAISLVDFDSKLQSAIEFVFGATFVCPDMESAKKVAFADSIRKRCVTLDAEIFDPAGTLSGGSMNNRPKLLIELSKMKDVQQQLDVNSHRLKEIMMELQQEIAKSEKFESIRDKYERKQSELNMCKKKMERSNYHQQIKEIENLKNSIGEEERKLKESREVKKKAEQRLKELKHMDSKSALQQELKKAESSLTECKKKAAASDKEYKKALQDLEQVRLEIIDINEGIASSEEQIGSLTTVIGNLEEQVASGERELEEKKKTVQGLSAEVKSQKSSLKVQSGELSKLTAEREAMSKEIGNCKLQMQQLEHDIAKCKSDSNEAENNVKRFLSTYEWIEEEKKYFGEPNTEYDFSHYHAKDVVAEVNELEEAKQRLSKIVNVRAQTMLANAEAQYQDLVAKKTLVLQDKDQIEFVIKELDEKKRLVLRSACEKVNKDFGSIFSTLLPGSKAKIIPQENKNVLEGLEFKVGFGEVWKESLAELSGGQRSLVALSLILSLLLFKPAPIYILDEVDAALDLSHTQNIGQMLKKHFQKSQFIVVSLKDGMFDNANVLFKTQFIDGMSTVSRTIPRRR